MKSVDFFTRENVLIKREWIVQKPWQNINRRWWLRQNYTLIISQGFSAQRLIMCVEKRLNFEKRLCLSSRILEVVEQ